MKLVKNAGQAWKWHSTQIFVILGALPVVWMQLPDDAKAMIPEAATPYIPALLAFAGLVGRLRDQS